MRHSTFVVLFAVSAASVGFAQSASTPKNSDAEWADVLRLATPAKPSLDAKVKKTRAVAEKEKQDKALLARQVEKAAKDFHTANPTHAEAGTARKMEAISALQGVIDGDTVHERAALSTAKEFRDDKKNPLPDRFEVALLSERTAARAKFGGNALANNPPELALVADALRTEFGDTPEVFNFYTSVARAADMNTAKAIADKLVQWPANPEAKQEAESIRARHALLNQTINVKLTTVDGREVDLSQQAGKVTLLFIWPAQSPGAVRLLSRVKKSLPGDAQVLYYAPGATAEQIAAAKTTASVPGLFCLSSRNADRDVTMEALGIRHLPYVFVLGRDGRLSGFGPVNTLSSLVALATKGVNTNP